MTEGIVYEVEAGKKVGVGAPSLLAMPNGRLLAAFDLTGADAKGLPGQRGHDKGGRWVQTKVYSSSDAGGTWTVVASLPMRCGRLFRDGGDVWLLGELNGALWLTRSPDGGGSWASPVAVTGEEGYTGRMTRPLLCGGDWAVAAWRAREGGGGEWVLWRAAAGGSLAAKKAWMRGAGTGEGGAEALVRGGAPGAGIPAGGVNAGWSDGGALVELPEGHPWGAGLAGVFAGRSGRADWAVTLRAGGGGWSGLGGAAVPWAWVRWPGGQSAFSVVRDAGGAGWWCVGQGGGARWGQAVHEEGGRRRLEAWWSADALEWVPRGVVCEGSGEGAEAARRDPSVAWGPGGRLWVACRSGTAGGRGMTAIRWASLGVKG